MNNRGQNTEYRRQNLDSFNAEAQIIVAKYDKKSAAVLPLLHFAQDKIGYVTPEAEAWVAKHSEVPLVHVHEVVTFYSMYHKNPVGKNHIRFCTTTSCVLMGGEKVLAHLKKKLGVENGGVTEDGKFSLEEAECLCACEVAPMMQVQDKYYGPLDEKKVDEILDKIK